MTFLDVVLECYDSKELMAQYRRLYGTSLGVVPARTPIEAMVDRETGHVPSCLDEIEALDFIKWVRRFVWDLLPAEAFQEAP
jgi:hypothetical protein